jgi:hypothetical protein
METNETNQLQTEVVETSEQTKESAKPSEFVGVSTGEQSGADTKSKETPNTESKVEPKSEVKAEPKKTYTSEEVAEIQSKKDGELAEYQKKLGQIALQQQIAEAQRQEAQAQYQDKREVESGEISQREADSRKQLRGQAAKLQQMIQQMTPQAETLGRIACANEMAKEYGISAEALIADTTLSSPQQMERKAAKMAMTAKDAEIRKLSVKPETFDKGPSGEVTGESSESLTAEQIEKMPIEEYARHKSIKRAYE